MKKYLGIKVVQAEPMTQGQQWAEGHDGVSCCEPGKDREGYKVVYANGYTSWSPKEVFEKSYKEIGEGLTFGEAIEAIKRGFRVSRTGWNGKGMYLKLIQGYPVNGHLNPAIGRHYDDGRTDDDVSAMHNIPEFTPDGSLNVTQGNPGQMLSHIIVKTSGDSQYWGEGYSDYAPWLASQTDILSEDWVIVE